MGKELHGLSYKELQQLEEQLREGVLFVKQKKVMHIYIYIYISKDISKYLVS